MIRAHLAQIVPDPPKLRDIKKYEGLDACAHQVLLDIVEVASKHADLGHSLLSGLVTLRDKIVADAGLVLDSIFFQPSSSVQP